MSLASLDFCSLIWFFYYLTITLHFYIESVQVTPKAHHDEDLEATDVGGDAVTGGQHEPGLVTHVRRTVHLLSTQVHAVQLL